MMLDLWTLTCSLFAATAVVWGGLYLWDWKQRPRSTKPSRPASLLQELTASHQLSADEVQQIRTLAQTLHLSDPVRLFVDPRLLEELASKSNGYKPAAVQLGQRLFGNEFRKAS